MDLIINKLQLEKIDPYNRTNFVDHSLIYYDFYHVYSLIYRCLRDILKNDNFN